MSYTVTCRVKEGSQLLSVTFESIDDALEQARSSIDKGMKEVLIGDKLGNRISGADLEACCRGVRILTNDLQAF